MTEYDFDQDELMFPITWPGCPNLQNMLPSRAKQVLIEHFLHVMESAPLGFSGNTQFTFPDAMLTVDQLHDEWIRKIAPTCYDEALELFETKYPLSWDNQKQKASRVGLDPLGSRTS